MGAASGNSNGVGNEADLYQQIANEFNLVYESIGKSKAEGVLKSNGLSIIYDFKVINSIFANHF